MILEITASLSLWLLDKVGGTVYDSIIKEDKDTIDKEFNDIIYNVSLKMQEKYPDILGGSIEFFFSRPNVVESIYNLLFTNSKISIKTIHNYFDINTLDIDFLSEFLSELKKELLKNATFNQLLTNTELCDLISSVTHKISNISEYTKLSTKELKKIRKHITKDNIFDFNNFMTVYRQTTINNISEINYLGLGLSANIKRGKKILTDIYVEPHISFKKSYNLRNIFSLTEKNLVILGNPGAGKSTLTKFILLNILSNLKFFKNKINNYIPFRIELRNYLKFKKETNLNIIDYVIEMLNYENTINITNKTFTNEIINKKDILFIFDGLDEIFDSEDKLTVKNDIENITNIHSNIYTIVTSRKIGYENAKLDHNYFEHILIKDFDKNQIDNYLKKWYFCEEIDADVINKEIKLFNNIIQEQSIDKELLSNPLFLSLIVMIFRNTHEIPNNKLEIYKSCTKTLVEMWDKNKKLKLSKKIISKQESIFANLAFWQYQTLSKKSPTIEYRFVCLEVQNIIKRLKLSKDDSKNETFASDFLEYAEKRSLYFDNNFTHKTFLEYYTAYWIFQNFEKKGYFKKRNKIIEKYSENTFWFIVFELLFSLIDYDQADNEILDSLYKHHMKNRYTFNLLLYCLPNINNISKNTIKKLIEKTIIYFINDYKIINNKNSNVDSFASRKYDLFRTFSLVSSNSRFSSIYKKCILNIYKESRANDEISYKIIQLHHEISFLTHRKSRKLFQKYTKHIDKLEKKYYLLYIKRVLPSQFNFDELIECLNLFGVNQSFEDPKCLYEADSGYGGAMWRYLDNQLEDAESFEKNMSYLIEEYDLFFESIINNIEKRYSSLSYSIEKNNIENIEKLLILLNKIQNKKVNKLLLYMLIEGISNSSISKHIRKLDFHNTLENKQHIEVIEYTLTKPQFGRPWEKKSITNISDFSKKLTQLLNKIKVS